MPLGDPLFSAGAERAGGGNGDLQVQGIGVHADASAQQQAGSSWERLSLPAADGKLMTAAAGATTQKGHVAFALPSQGAWSIPA
jgi:hypothetical protein